MGNAPPAADPVRRRVRRLLLIAIALLYGLSVPWYRDPQAPLSLWLGLPDWVTVAVACYVAIACLNALAWWITAIEDPPETPPTGPSTDIGDLPE